jgi:hypothetical protein
MHLKAHRHTADALEGTYAADELEGTQLMHKVVHIADALGRRRYIADALGRRRYIADALWKAQNRCTQLMHLEGTKPMHLKAHS